MNAAGHELKWVSNGFTDYRWQCTCGFRPATNWPASNRTWRAHLAEQAA